MLVCPSKLYIIGYKIDKIYKCFKIMTLKGKTKHLQILECIIFYENMGWQKIPPCCRWNIGWEYSWTMIFITIKYCSKERSWIESTNKAFTHIFKSLMIRFLLSHLCLILLSFKRCCQKITNNILNMKQSSKEDKRKHKIVAVTQ